MRCQILVIQSSAETAMLVIRRGSFMLIFKLVFQGGQPNPVLGAGKEQR